VSGGHQTISQRYLTELWPAIGSVQSSPSLDVSHGWELPYGERSVIDAIVRFVQPAVAYEFGTFSGSTTMLIANAAPDGAVVHTIDLPDEVIVGPYADDGITAEMIGERLRNRATTRAAITSHRQDIGEFDFEPFKGGVQFIFIDASHDYEDVLRDSQKALEILSADGVIVWDDYMTPKHPGVTMALDELSRELPLVSVTSTRLLFMAAAASLRAPLVDAIERPHGMGQPR
jgi:predicted O-methyltransferase YrrM